MMDCCLIIVEGFVPLVLAAVTDTAADIAN
jgi:hypothetical protein